MSNPSEYAVTIRRLPEALGNGYLALVPDLPGCMSDGETPREAFENAQDAIECWIEAAQEMGHPIPDPTAPEPELLRKYG
jgi:antitoxin HicB